VVGEGELGDGDGEEIAPLKFDALRLSVTGIKDLMFWMAVAIAEHGMGMRAGIGHGGGGGG
jgi:hypothetical protein